MNTRKTKVFATMLLGAVCIALGATDQAQRMLSDYIPSVFVRYWANKFSDLDVRNGRVNVPGEIMLHQRFEDGTWFVGIATCSDAGGYFNRGVFLVSSGQIYATSYPFSGYEGFDELFKPGTLQSLDAFLIKGSQYGFSKVGFNGRVATHGTDRR